MAEEKKKLSEGPEWTGILSFGFFILLLGSFWIITPNLTEEVETFFNPENWDLTNVTQHVTFPEPKHNYPVLYTAAMQFCFVFGVFQIVVLALRFMLHESLDKVGAAISGMVFWFGISFFFSMLASETIRWFGFLAGLIIFVGLAIIVRGVVGLFR